MALSLILLLALIFLAKSKNPQQHILLHFSDAMQIRLKRKRRRKR